MKTLTLIHKQSGECIVVRDSIGSSDNIYSINGERSWRLSELIDKYKFPYLTGNVQYDLVEYICQDANLFAMVEFYLIEE